MCVCVRACKFKPVISALLDDKNSEKMCMNVPVEGRKGVVVSFKNNLFLRSQRFGRKVTEMLQYRRKDHLS